MHEGMNYNVIKDIFQANNVIFNLFSSYQENKWYTCTHRFSMNPNVWNATKDPTSLWNFHCYHSVLSHLDPRGSPGSPVGKTKII